MNIGRGRQLLSGVVVAGFIAAGSLAPVQAAMIGTAQMAQAPARDAQLSTVENFLSRADVRAQLQDWGVAPEAAEARVAALTDAELERLAATIDQQPAGGDVLAVVGVVFVVLLILELVGVTNIFSQF